MALGGDAHSETWSEATRARLAQGVPLHVIAHDLRGDLYQAPWELVLANAAQRLVGQRLSPDQSDAMVARLAQGDPLEETLVSRGLRTRLRTRLGRRRIARRAREQAMAEMVGQLQATLDAYRRPNRVDAHREGFVGTGELSHEILDRLCDLETLLCDLEAVVMRPPLTQWSSAPARIVALEGLLFGVPGAEWTKAAVLEHRGHPEPGLRSRLEERLTAGRGFVDVGAGIGLYAVSAARIVGSEGHVWAFEPTPATCSVLRGNVALNDLPEGATVDVRQVAVGAERGGGHLAVYPEDSGRNSLYAVAAGDASIRVEVTPLDHAIPAGSRVDVVTIDVEGAELDVLRGMARIAAENPQVVAFAAFADEHLRRAGASSKQFLAEVERLGWSYEIFETHSGRPAASGGAVKAAPLTAFLWRAGPDG